MASLLSSRRPTNSIFSLAICYHCQQIRNATLLRRPKRPYTFTQLITLTDGSSYLHRTTSPAPVYRATKDIRNSPLWNPSSQKLMNIEEDEAGKLRTFRAKFGRGWDAATVEDAREGEEELREEQKEESLFDLISEYGQLAEGKDKVKGTSEAINKSGKGKADDK